MRLFIRFLILSLISPAAWATCTGSGCNCIVTATPLALGNYSPINGNVNTSTGIISVTCTRNGSGSMNVSYTINLSTGSSGTYNPRTLKNGINSLNDNLYTSSSYTTIWGNNTSGTGRITDSYSSSTHPITRNYTVYGRVSASQTATKPGTYLDTITVTVTY